MNVRSTFRVHIDLATSGGTAEAAVLDQHYVQINGVSYGRTLLTEKATPATPASGFGDIYFKSDGYLYSLNDSGTETQLGSGGGVTGFATPAIVLGTAAAAGAATTVIRSDSTIMAFDATVPTTQAFSDAAATGSAAVAARRDHLHGMPVAPVTDHEHINNVQFSGDGSTTAFELPAAPFDENAVVASVAGVIQDVTLSGTMLTTMTFASAPSSGTNNVRVDIVAIAA